MTGIAQFVAQSIFVPLFAIIFSAIFPYRAEESPWHLINFAPTLLGLLMGYVVATTWPSARWTGRWIWIIPFVALLYEITFVGTNRPLSYRIYQKFLGNDPLGQWLLTYPTLTNMFYALGIIGSEALRRQPGPSAGAEGDAIDSI
jgi:hypothetical protein